MKLKETGVYCILNIINGKCYIGSSSDDFEKRWSIHKHYLKNNKHANSILQNSWNKYGESNFEFFVLEIVEPKLCVEREQFFIDSIKPEMNILKKAGSSLGFKHSKLSNEKKSLSLIGHVVTQNTKEKISKSLLKRFANSAIHSMFGKKHSNHTKLLISSKRNLQDVSCLFKKVKQIDKENGSIINVWESIKSAGISLKIHRNNISSACNGKLKSAGGFRWEKV